MKKLCTLWLLVFCWQASAWAQGLDLAAEDPNKPVELTLQPDPDVPKGKTAVMHGEADAAGHRFLVRGLDVMQPVSVTAFSQKTGAPLRTELYKENWQQSERSESTGDKGRTSYRFRTVGDLGVWVKSEGPEPVPYYLVVWAGDALELPVPSPFRAATVAELKDGTVASAGGGADTAGGLGTTGWLAIVAGLLVVIGGLLVAVLRGQRRGRVGPDGTVVSVLLLMLLATPAWASPPLPASGRDAAAAWEASGYEQLANANASGGGGASVPDVLGLYETLTDVAETAQAYGLLHPSDEASQPAYRAEGQPEVPSACDGNASCTECYTQAQQDLGGTRRALEKLRIIGNATKNRSDKVIALGDAAAGALPGSAAGLAWIKEKKGIQDEMATFEQAYDRKHRELLGNLRDNLQAIGRCEEQLGVRDWYNRYGFVYYQFMEERYKRSW